jgi:putative membrane protein
MRHISLILKGMLYGFTHVAPGLGGAIVLILLGIYEEFVEAVGNLLVRRERWRQYLGFLVPLGIGMVAGIVLSAILIDDLLQRFPAATMFVFIGLLAGTIPSILRLHGDMRPTPGRLVGLAAGIGIVVGINALEGLAVGRTGANTLSSAREIAYHSVVSFLAGGASVTPGMDGSTILLIGGTYGPVLNAVAALRNLDIRWAALLSTAIFAALGIVLFSKLIDALIKRGRSQAYYVVLGLVLGSIYDLWTRTDVGATAPWVLALCSVAGAICALLLGRGSEESPLDPEVSTLVA